MPHGGDDLFNKIMRRKSERRGVYARVAAEALIFQQVTVNEQPHLTGLVVHQAQHADRARCDIKAVEHLLRACEGQPRRAYLL